MTETIYRLNSSVELHKYSGAIFSQEGDKTKSDDEIYEFSFFPPDPTDPMKDRPLPEPMVEALEKRWISVKHPADSPFGFLSSMGVGRRWGIVTEEIKNIFEELDPGVHDIYRVPNVWSLVDDKPITEPALWLVHVRQRVRTVDIERSKTHKLSFQINGEDRYTLTAMVPEQQTVYASALKAGLNVWNNDFTDAMFCTQAFHDRLTSIPTGHDGAVLEGCTVI